MAAKRLAKQQKEIKTGLVGKLLALAEKHEIEWLKVKGHGDELNIRCDELPWAIPGNIRPDWGDCGFIIKEADNVAVLPLITTTLPPGS